ncbi:MAG: hypothetical protein EXR72_18180 [Myxococcales bacterium]|nr:hypothetical protein [Myxococcales bacterium]
MRAPLLGALRTLVVLGLLLGVARSASADNVSGARDHYRRASKLYDQRRYLEAATEFEAAYAAKDDPVFLYNVAQAYRLAGELEGALSAYGSYLKRSPRASNREEVDARILELQKAIEQQRQAPAQPPLPTVTPPVAPGPPPPALPPPPRPGRALLFSGIAVAGVGVAALVVGVVFGVQALTLSDQLSHPTPGQVFDPSVESSGQTAQWVGIGLLAGGGVALIGGAALFALGLRARHREAPIALAPAFGPGRAGLLVAGIF